MRTMDAKDHADLYAEFRLGGLHICIAARPARPDSIDGSQSPGKGFVPITMDDNDLLDALSDDAFRQMSAVDDDLARMEEPYKTIAIIYSSQGVIDNGGLTYFFANDWPHKPPYSEYADAYERIGCIEAANALRSAAASFTIERPELHRERRLAYIEANYDEATLGVKGWDDCICGDERVWENLAAWARTIRSSGR